MERKKHLSVLPFALVYTYFIYLVILEYAMFDLYTYLFIFTIIIDYSSVNKVGSTAYIKQNTV